MTFWLSLLLFFLLVRYVLPRVLRAVLGRFVRQQMNKAQQGGFYAPQGFDPRGGYQAQQHNQQAQQSQQQQSQYSEPTTRPGQVRVDYVPPTPAKGDRRHEFRGGEYVDYEEL